MSFLMEYHGRSKEYRKKSEVKGAESNRSLKSIQRKRQCCWVGEESVISVGFGI